MINIPNIDQKIWNPEYHTIDIIQQLLADRKVDINIDSEGADLVELGLIRLLDTIAEKFSIDKKNICIRTRNVLENTTEYTIIKTPPTFFLAGQKFVLENKLLEKQFKDIKHFGIFAGRSNWQRLFLASYLYKNYKDQLRITFHYDPKIEFHKNNLGFDDLSHMIGPKEAASVTADLLKDVPLLHEHIDTYPIPSDYDIGKIYHQVFSEIVCETYSAGTTFFPTEKTWRPIACRTPFMVQGPADFLKNLRQMGFKTFRDWWDEGYDEDIGVTRIEAIQSNIDKLSKLSTAELESMYKDMLPTINHNYEIFMNLNLYTVKQYANKK